MCKLDPIHINYHQFTAATRVRPSHIQWQPLTPQFADHGLIELLPGHCIVASSCRRQKADEDWEADCSYALLWSFVQHCLLLVPCSSIHQSLSARPIVQYNYITNYGQIYMKRQSISFILTDLREVKRHLTFFENFTQKFDIFLRFCNYKI